MLIKFKIMPHTTFPVIGKSDKDSSYCEKKVCNICGCVNQKAAKRCERCNSKL